MKPAPNEDSPHDSPRLLVSLSPCLLVFLIGPRGSGKSTVARLLAARLGWDWLDADHELERRHSRTIRDIFATEGEPSFRDKESAILADLCRLRRHVVATGGGVVLRPENRERMRTSGQVIWLTADPAILAARLEADAATAERRPSLTGMTAASSVQEIDAVLKVREPLYRSCADFITATAGRSPEAVTEELLNWWNAESGIQTNHRDTETLRKRRTDER